MADDRRPRGFLEADIKRVCDAWVTGEYVVVGEKPLTPYRAALALKEMDQLDEAPSSGAVSAVFDRWVEIGFMEASRKPYAFAGYTEAARTKGLAALHKEWRERKRAAKAALREQDADTDAEAV